MEEMEALTALLDDDEETEIACNLRQSRHQSEQILRQNLMLFKTLRKGVLARFIVGAAAMGASESQQNGQYSY